MKRWIICLICVFLFSACAPTKDYSQRRGLMLLENYELPRNKPTKFSKKKLKKKIERKNKKYLRKLKRKS